MKKENTTRESKLAIVNEAVEANNLSELDNLETFFETIIEELEDMIEDKTSFIEDLKKTNSRATKNLKKEIADAEKFVNKAYVQVESSKITTHANIKTEMVAYWERVRSAQRSLKYLEEKLEASVKASKEEISEHTLMLKQYEDYLAQIKR